MAYSLVTIGHWTLIIGIILSVLVGFCFTKTPYYLLAFPFILGLVVGFLSLNLKEKESTSFLVAVIALLLIGVSGFQLAQMLFMPVVVRFRLISSLSNFISFVAGAALMAAIKQILAGVRRD